MTTPTLASPALIRNTDHCSFRIDTVPRLAAIGDTDLRSLTAGRSFYVSRPWLESVELQWGDQASYLTCRDENGALLGVCPVYWGESDARGYYNPYEHFLRRSDAEFDRADWSPTYIVGSRSAYSCEFLVDTTMEAERQRDVLALLLDAATAHAKEVDAASLSALYLNPHGAAQLREVLPADQGFYLAGANCVVDVRWSSIDEYVKSTGRQAVNIRREMRVFNSQGYTLVSGRLSDWVDVAAGFFSQLEHRYGNESSASDEAAKLRPLVSSADEHSHIIAIRDGATTIGVMLLFLWEGVIYVRSVGFDYEKTKNAFEYFNLVYYETIRYAIQHGYQGIDLGMATYRAKLARGARLEPRWGLSLSRTADSPLSNHRFRRWDQLRRDAVRAADPDLLESAQLP